MKKFLLITGILTWVGCTNSNSVDITVQIGSNQTQNPIIAIHNGLGTANSGIFFVFEQLNCPPSSPSDVNVSVPKIQYPNSGGGDSPTQSSYAIPASLLNHSQYYRVTMVSYNNASTPLYEGFSDCPINLSVGGANHATICFGAVGTPPLCAGTTPFASCAGVTLPLPNQPCK